MPHDNAAGASRASKGRRGGTRTVDPAPSSLSRSKDEVEERMNGDDGSKRKKFWLGERA